MLKVLLKKQLSEIFRNYFYNQKTNKPRSVASTVSFLVLYVLLMVGIIGGMFAFLSYQLCGPLVSGGLGWMYFALLSLIAVVLGTFGSVFNTYAGLYLAKDNDQLLSMPIPVRDIIISRLLGVYLMGLLFSATVSVPVAVVYLICAPFSVGALFGLLLMIFLVSVIVLLLSCLLGWVVAKISLKLKNKSFITVLLSLLFLAGYYFVYFKAQNAIAGLLTNAGAWGDRIKGSAYPVYLFGRVGEGDPLAMLIVTAVLAALFALMWVVLSRSFIRIATAGGSGSRAVYREKQAKVRGIGRAMLGKEFARFFSSPTYMLNCGLGLIFLAAAAVFLLIRGGDLMEILRTGIFLFGEDMSRVLPLFFCAALCMMAGTIDITSPSVSLEGKNLWLVQSLPVTAWQALRAKLLLQIILTAPLTLLCSVIGVVLVRPDPLSGVLMLLLPQVFTVFMAEFGLTVNLLRPSLKWSNEIYPIKQSMSVMIALFGGWIWGVLPFGVYMIAGGKITAGVCLGVYAALNAALTVFLLFWLRKKGTVIFEEL